MWQDYVFAVGPIVFVCALIPAVLRPSKPSLATSGPTAFVLSMFAGTYLTMGFYYAMVSTSLTACLWWVLFLQGLRRRSLES